MGKQALGSMQVMRERPGQISGLSSTAIMQLLEIIVFGKDALYLACNHGNSTVPPSIPKMQFDTSAGENPPLTLLIYMGSCMLFTFLFNVWTYIFSMPTLITQWGWVGGIMQGSLLQGQTIACQLFKGRHDYPNSDCISQR